MRYAALGRQPLEPSIEFLARHRLFGDKFGGYPLLLRMQIPRSIDVKFTSGSTKFLRRLRSLATRDVDLVFEVPIPGNVHILSGGFHRH